MKFTKLVIDNYKSFQLPVEIRFPVGSSGKSIFLIGGMILWDVLFRAQQGHQHLPLRSQAGGHLPLHQPQGTRQGQRERIV